MSEEYDLKTSVAKLGRLVPIIKDAHGNIIDGFHRKAVDPQWTDEFSIKLDNITDPVQLLLARMNINTHRRTVSAEEKTQWLKELAELTKWTPQEIADHSGMSYGWVMKYLPSEYKTVSVPIVSRRETTEIPVTEGGRKSEQTHKGTCSNCRLDSWFIHENGLCGLCDARLKKGEISLAKPVVTPKRPEPLPPRVETRVMKPPESWEQRKAVMTPGVSKMEDTVLSKLEQKGVHLEVQREFCLQHTRPDFYDSKNNVAFYLDGPVHRGREDRDDLLRGLLTKRYGVRVVSILYEGDSEATVEKIVTDIMQAI